MRNINGGTDHIYYDIPATPSNTGTLACWFRTTQATANAALLCYWSNGSRNGPGLLLNNSANKITAQGYPNTGTPRVNIASTTSINDGNPHHVAFSYNRFNAGANALYIDGVSEATANSSAAWAVVTNYLVQLGDPQDAFWASYVGDIWDVAHWRTQLTVEEVASLARGYSPARVRPSELNCYAPLVRDTHCLVDLATHNNTTGTTVADHNRVVGGAV
jgi:hypothetical protein